MPFLLPNQQHQSTEGTKKQKQNLKDLLAKQNCIN